MKSTAIQMSQYVDSIILFDIIVKNKQKLKSKTKYHPPPRSFKSEIA